jgi:hypothetical protein
METLYVSISFVSGSKTTINEDSYSRVTPFKIYPIGLKPAD